MSPQEVIIRPVVTEKSADLESAANQYVFEVSKAANKIEIAKAVSIVFGVRVSKVRTMVVRSELTRVGRFWGRNRSWKKAVVTLYDGDSINLYGDE